MKKTQTLFLAGILCILALVSMVLALVFGRTHTQSSSFTPPPFDSSAESGTPVVPEELGWTEIYQDGMAFKCSICGNVIASGGVADVYFTNSSEQEIWLKLRVLDEDGNIIGETGLVKPGEYVKSVSIDKDISDGSSIKLKIMAYEPETYYSAGAVTLNTKIGKEAA